VKHEPPACTHRPARRYSGQEHDVYTERRPERRFLTLRALTTIAVSIPVGIVVLVVEPLVKEDQN